MHTTMRRKEQSIREDTPPGFPVMNMTNVSVGLHTQQQSLILNEMSASRKKLEEENQKLREDLEEARHCIQILKLKLHESKMTVTTSSVNSKDSTVKGGLPSRHWHALDATTQHKKSATIFGRWAAQKNAFRNPTQPGKKTFTSDNEVLRIQKRVDTQHPAFIVVPSHATCRSRSVTPVKNNRMFASPSDGCCMSRPRPRSTRPRESLDGPDTPTECCDIDTLNS
jgi:hypothetical protein